MKYLFLLAFLPLLLIAFVHFSKAHKLELIHEEIATLYRTVALREAKQHQNRLARERYQGAHHELSTFPLLSYETEALRTLLDENPTLPVKELAKRLTFLQEDNRLIFTENDVLIDAQVQESTQALAHPVECDTNDLILLLNNLNAEDAPQFIVRNFSLRRKESLGDNETFLLDLQLIKREYL